MEDEIDKIEEIKTKDGEPSAKWQMHGHHHGTKLLLLVIGILIIAGGAVAVAKFATGHERFGNGVNFERTGMMGGRGFTSGRGMMGRGANFARQDLTRGVSGDITKIDGNTVTINNGVKDIAVNLQSTTSFTKNGQVAKQSDLIVGNNIIVSGSSDSSGVVQATSVLIR